LLFWGKMMYICGIAASCGGFKTRIMLTHWKLAGAKDPNYLGSHDLINQDGTFKEVVLTVKQTYTKDNLDVAGSKQRGTVMEFVEAGYKPLLLNATNRQTCANLWRTPFVENWNGRAITLFVVGGVNNPKTGSKTEAIRIRPSFAVVNVPLLEPSHKNWQKCVNALVEGVQTIEDLQKLPNFILNDANKALLLEAVKKAKDAPSE